MSDQKRSRESRGNNQNNRYHEGENQNNGQYNNGPYNQGPQNNGQYNNGPYNQGSQNNSQYNNGPQNNESYGNGSNDGKKPKSSKRKMRRRVIFAIEIIVLLVLALGLFVWAKYSQLNTKDIAEGDIIINSEISSEQAEVLKGYWNIALYGVDSRDGLTSDALSDTIMVASINRETKDVKLVSVYRDTYLDNTNGEYRKATECYLRGGPERSINMLNKNLDLDIKDFVTVNFEALAEVVDAVKGIEIDIQEDEIIHLNNYQQEGSQVTGKEIITVDYPGLQTLNGLQALSYCRIRYTAGNDYKRTERQRTVLEKIMQKAKTTDLLTLNNIINTVLPNMATSLEPTEMVALAKDLASYNIAETTGFPFNHLPDNNAAGDCVVPVNLSQNVIDLHQYLFGSNGYTPSTTVQEISNKIINDTGIQ